MVADREVLERVARALYPAGDVEYLGAGGFACTFRVTVGPDTLAVKVLDPVRSDPVRDVREARALEMVSHDRVVRYRRYAEFEFEGVPYRYLEMDFVAGRSLQSELGGGRTFLIAEALQIIEDVVAGAQAIWAAGLAHRDLSPANVLLTGDGRAIVVDLGLARHMDLGTVTMLPAPGTPGWMAPEQVGSAPQRGDWRSDQFVIGLLAWRLLTNNEPYLERNVFHRWEAPARLRLGPIASAQPAIPGRLADFVDRLLAPEPYRRFLHSDDLAEHLAVAAEDTRAGDIDESKGEAFAFSLIIGQTKNVFDAEFCQVLAPDALILDAPNHPDWRVDEFADAQIENAGFLIDPASYLDRSPTAVRKASYRQLPYGDGPQVAAPFPDEEARRNYCTPIVRYQTDRGANPILSPYFAAMPGEPDWIDESLACARTTADLVGGGGTPDSPVLATVAVTAGYLVGGHLTELLNRVTAEPPRRLQILVETSQPTFAPLADLEVLQGLRELLALCSEARISAAVGRRYSSGLLMGAFGASGWSTGLSALHQNFQRHPDVLDGRGGQAAPWYYVPSMLNSIRLDTRALLLNRPGLDATPLEPTNRYGEELFADDRGRVQLDTASRILLNQHNLLAMREQASRLSGRPLPERRRIVRQLVDGALTVYQALAGPWNAGEGPEFLEAWKQAL